MRTISTSPDSPWMMHHNPPTSQDLAKDSAFQMVATFSTGIILKNAEMLMIAKNCFTLWKNCWAEWHPALCAGLFILTLTSSALFAPLPLCARDICGYTNPEYSKYNRLLKVEVNRGGKKVGEVHYSYQFDGYYVRCVTGGVSSKRFFARARDARWTACGSCY